MLLEDLGNVFLIDILFRIFHNPDKASRPHKSCKHEKFDCSLSRMTCRHKVTNFQKSNACMLGLLSYHIASLKHVQITFAMAHLQKYDLRFLIYCKYNAVSVLFPLSFNAPQVWIYTKLVMASKKIIMYISNIKHDVLFHLIEFKIKTQLCTCRKKRQILLS